jgi:RNA polymerase sigma factor for flagellar operon FliA
VEFKNTATYANRATDRDGWILENLSICKAIALRIQKTVPGQVELDDLIQAGVLGLIDAAEKYDPTKQVEFSSYARHRIRGAILDSLRELDFASRDLRRRWKKMEAATGELRNTLHRDPTESEIAEWLNIGIEELRILKCEAQSASYVSTQYTSAEGETVEQEFIGPEETRPDNVFCQAEMRAALDKAMKPLPPRQQQVVTAYYSGQKTMKEIGDWLGITECRVSQLHKSALVKMETVLRANGVHSGGAF